MALCRENNGYYWEPAQARQLAGVFFWSLCLDLTSAEEGDINFYGF